MIEVRVNGDFKKTDLFFHGCLDGIKLKNLQKYGEIGVSALAAATPVDTGLTAHSWSYTIERAKDRISLVFNNSHVAPTNPNINIAIILQYGHGTRNGGYVRGRDYINPVMRPLFDTIAEEAWKEVTGS